MSYTRNMSCKHQTLPKGHYCSFCGEMLIKVCELYTSNGTMPCTPRCKSCKDWGESKKPKVGDILEIEAESKKCEEEKGRSGEYETRCYSCARGKPCTIEICSCPCHQREQKHKADCPLEDVGYSKGQECNCGWCKAGGSHKEGDIHKFEEHLWRDTDNTCHKDTPKKCYCGGAFAGRDITHSPSECFQDMDAPKPEEERKSECCKDYWSSCAKCLMKSLKELGDAVEAAYKPKEPEPVNYERERRLFAYGWKAKEPECEFRCPKQPKGCGHLRSGENPECLKCGSGKPERDTYTRKEINDKMLFLVNTDTQAAIDADEFRIALLDILKRVLNRPMFDYEAGMLEALKIKFLS